MRITHFSLFDDDGVRLARLPNLWSLLMKPAPKTPEPPETFLIRFEFGRVTRAGWRLGGLFGTRKPIFSR